MKNPTEEATDAIKTLIETCQDSAQGFREATKDTKDSDLKALFQRYASEREEFVRELQHCVRRHGNVFSEPNGSLGARLHRGWIGLKAALSAGDPHAILAECERGEDLAVQAYRQALERPLDPVARDIASRQFSAVLSARNRVRDLLHQPTYLHA